MEAYGSDYKEGFSDITYSEFSQEFFQELVFNYVLEKCPEILEGEDFMDFRVNEYNENLIKEFNEPPNQEEIW